MIVSVKRPDPGPGGDREGRRRRRSRIAGIAAAGLTFSITLHWLVREAFWTVAASSGADVVAADFEKPSQVIWSFVIAVIVAGVAGRRAHDDLKRSVVGREERVRLGPTLWAPVIGGSVAYGILLFLFFNTRDSVFV
ncbi:MAG: hypothetical protein KQH57_08140 [Actinomycetales bacterium]|nr:hypothetical protein [Actinomycetales bacterium]